MDKTPLEKTLQPRPLGRSGLTVSPMGMGTWALGGPFHAGPDLGFSPPGQPLGWGEADDAESIRALHCALDCGVTFFDSSSVYGAGHAEEVLGAALQGRREGVLIATKFGYTHDAGSRLMTGTDVSPRAIREACIGSLRRLRTDRIDLYQLHVGDLAVEPALEVADVLNRLLEEGLIRCYGWSTDDPARAAAFAERTRAVAIQHDMNLFEDAPEMLAVCRAHDLASIDRRPLAMGFLTGTHGAAGRLPADDIRARPPASLRYFEAGGGAAPEWLARLAELREVLTAGGRSLAQGALAWLWARDTRTIPIPGARSEAQVRENAGAMAFGPLTPAQMAEVEAILSRAAA